MRHHDRLSRARRIKASEQAAYLPPDWSPAFAVYPRRPLGSWPRHPGGRSLGSAAKTGWGS